MHSPKKKKKKTSLAIHTKLSMCRATQHDMSYQEKGRIREVRIKQHFYIMKRINPLGSTVSIVVLLG
ncbi:unnamed protein product [Staurois parvus]|uniref:Uncharacterized protein n=1 Tax=Staurois parvus TaxID=386267 RepID=A0ABN9HFW0_9NEOB|nr:unnamed protein product [Staurois parvus]